LHCNSNIKGYIEGYPYLLIRLGGTPLLLQVLEPQNRSVLPPVKPERFCSGYLPRTDPNSTYTTVWYCTVYEKLYERTVYFI